MAPPEGFEPSTSRVVTARSFIH